MHRQAYEWKTNPLTAPKDFPGSGSVSTLFLQHISLLFYTLPHNLWTIPVECGYYIILPIPVLLYHAATRFESRTRPAFQFGMRCLGIFIFIGFMGSMALYSMWERKSFQRRLYFYTHNFLVPEYLIVFGSGTLAGIVFWEMQEWGLLLRRVGCLDKQIQGTGPKRMRDDELISDWEIKQQLLPTTTTTTSIGIATEATTTTSIATSNAASGIATESVKTTRRNRVDPMLTYSLRLLTDGACYAIVLLLILLDTTTLKHFTPLLPWLPRFKDSEVITGLLYGLLFLCGLWSEKSFNRIFHWNLLTYAGKISFSLYLWHPLFLELVFNEIWGEKAIYYDQVTKDNYTNNFFDLFFYALASSWAGATVMYWLVEVPALSLCSYLVSTLPQYSSSSQ